MGGEDARPLTYDEAISLLPDGDEIRVILDGDVALISAVWDRAGILKLLATSGRLEVTGPQAQAQGHGLAAWLGNVPVFVETKPEAGASRGAEAGRLAVPAPGPIAGAATSLDPAGFHPALRRAIEDFRGRYGQRLHDPLFARERCQGISEEFAKLCRGYLVPATVISGVRLGQHPAFPGIELVLAGHFAVLMPSQRNAGRAERERGPVIDWTARQFAADAPVPSISTLASWRQTWRDLAATGKGPDDPSAGLT